MLPEPPPSLRYIWTAQNDEGVLFRSFRRQINNSPAMASVMIRGKLPPGNSHAIVVIQGKAYFLMGPLQADAGASAKFAQLYLHDTDETKHSWLSIGQNYKQQFVCAEVFAVEIDCSEDSGENYSISRICGYHSTVRLLFFCVPR